MFECCLLLTPRESKKNYLAYSRRDTVSETYSIGTEQDTNMSVVAHEHSVDCREVPIEKVTVFSDRAEIKRSVTVPLQLGNNEVMIKHISGSVIDDSVRVSGRGNAVIHEVQVAHRQATEKEKSCPQALELRTKIDELAKEFSEVQQRRQVIAKKRAALENIMNKMGTTDKEGNSLNINEGTFEGIQKMFDFYEDKVIQLHGTDDDLKKSETELNEKLNILRSEHNRYINPAAVKTVTVVLEASEAGECELGLAYQIYGASWQPTYDVRVDTTDKKEMQIGYYGNVRQQSGEDWNGCQLVLSTARPSVGGTVPELGTLDVKLYVPPPPPQTRTMARGGGPMGFGAAPAAAMMKNSLFSGAAPVMEVATASVSEQALSSEFAILRPAAIPPDGSDHKVTIGVATLKPILSHECVPSKNNSVFLTASTINSSELPFLPGQASIFLDGNFISKSSLKAVSPNERFTVSLGVDSSVRVDYKPAHQKQGEVGIINKNSTSVKEQKIVVRNTKKEPILITVKENLPRSTDEKIKVKLISPAANVAPAHVEGEPRREGAIVTPAHNIEWTMMVAAGHHKELIVKWQIDYPSSEKLEYQEKY